LTVSEKTGFVQRLNREIMGLGEFLSEHIPEGAYQMDYVAYLKRAYYEGREIVLTPDIVYFTLLCEVARMVDDLPEFYRNKFTTGKKEDGRKKLFVETSNPRDLSEYLIAFMPLLRENIPGGLADEILAEFTTTDGSARLAQHAAFADMAKHYYEYCGCQGAQGPSLPPDVGIKHVHLKGGVKDWGTLRTKWVNVMDRLFGSDTRLKMREYRLLVAGLLEKLAIAAEVGEPMQEFLCQIYNEAYRAPEPWFSQLFAPYDLKGGITEHVARVPYTSMSDKFGKEHLVLVVGILSSHLDGKVLVPEFGCAAFKNTNAADFS